MAEREYEVTEHFHATQLHFVRASNRAEALRKVFDSEQDYTDAGDPFPSRPMTVRDVRLVRARSDADRG